MPGTRIVETTEYGCKLHFTEDDHKYIVKNNITGQTTQLISVTTLIDRYFPEFNSDEMAARVAKKRGTTPQAVQAEWDRIRDEASRYGTRVHEYMEDLLNGNPVRNTPENEKERIVFGYGAKFAKKLKSTVTNIEPEKMLCDVKLGLAGTVDLLCQDPTDSADNYMMLDWKTNKKIDMKSIYDEHGLGPLAHLDDCEYAHYCLQLNMYDFILHHVGYIPKHSKVSKYLVHIHPETGLRLIPVGDMKNEIKAILMDWLSKTRMA